MRKELQKITALIEENPDLSPEEKEQLLRNLGASEQELEKLRRELEIEAALERVRARSMAMHKTEELQDVINTVYQQFLQLEVRITGGAFIVINADIDSELVCWGAGGTAEYIEKVHLPFMDMPIYTELLKGIKKGPGFFTESFSQEEKQPFFEELFRIPPYNKATEERKKEVVSRPGGYTRSCVVSPYTSIFIINHHGRPFTGEENEILRRMGKVFEQTYTRFLDLQKAEAQAREAQIEAALERVRARSMAMHKSEELKEVIRVIFDQLAVLDINAEHAGIVVDYEPGQDWTFWVAETQDIPSRVTIPYLGSLWDRQFAEAKEKGNDFFTTHLDFEEKNTFYKALLPYIPNLTEKAKNFYFECPGLAISTTVHEDTGLYIENFSGTPYSAEENTILKRFGNVFQQTYTRFLDLKKAEVQAREAQIEAALERIRSRAMGMQKGDELVKVVRQIDKEIAELGIELDVSNIFTDYTEDPRTGINVWTEDSALEEINYLEKLHVPYLDHPLTRSFYKKLNSGTDLIIEKYSKSQKNTYFNLLFDQSDYRTKTPKERKNSVLSAPGWVRCSVVLKNSILNFARFSLNEFLEEEKAIFKRIGKVFQQAYTRFLDLKKAEEQAREAQIEAALERVRARTMAMHHSEELGDVAAVLFDQMNALVSNLWTCGFVLCEKDRKEDEWWLGMDDGFTRGFFLPNVGDYAHATLYEGWLKGDDFRIVSLEGEALQEHYNWLMQMPVSRKIFEEMDAAGLERPEHQKLHAAYFSKGYLCIITQQPCPEAEIFKRFAQVFDLTYTRFLDLKKAEAQAREAQIEAALERVRAASMAMHKTDELGKVVEVLFQQFSELNLDFYQVWINIFFIEEGYSNCWFSPVEGIIEEAYTAEVPLGPFEETSIKSWRAGEEFSYLSWEGVAEVDKIMENLSEMTGHPSFGRIQKNRRMDRLEIVDCNHRYGVLAMAKNDDITEEDHSILKRFTKVFEQTYTRFLDLKKAEAQAREAQIEASLERVRARSMAMQSTEELSDVLSVLFLQFDLLGIDPKTAWLTLWNPEDHTFTYRSTGISGLRIQGQQVLDIDGMDIWKELYEKWKTDTSDSVEVLFYPKEDLKQLFGLLEETFSAMPKKERLTPEHFPNGGYSVQGHCKFGYLGYTHTREPSEEEKEILTRFAMEFGRVYQRFLDIQKAEAQAREAQIEAALERVRARAMAMHTTEELGDVLCVLFEQFDFLGINPVLTHLTLFDEESETFSFRMTTSPESKILVEQIIDLNAVEAWKDAFKVWKHSDPNVVNCIDYPPEALPQVWDLMSEVMNALPKKHRIYPEDFPDGLYTVQGHCQFGYLGFNIKRKATKEEIEIVRKFATEFGRLYQRFLDLKKAEAQAREAQIEAALERVRARTMAMHKSEELGEVAAVLFEQINNLGATLERLNIGIVREDEEIIAWWSTEQGGRQIDRLFKGSIHEPTTISKVYTAWKEGTKSLELDQTGQELKQWIRYVTEVIGLPFDPKLMQERRVHAAAFFKHGTLLVSTPEPLPEGSINLLERFAAVFEQTYTRFLDLQKAEKQARESEIEAALERVRAKTMAMHNTNDIADTVVTFFEELVGLGLDDSMRAGIGILSQSEQMQLWTASVSGTSKTLLHSGSLDMSSHPTLEGVKSAWSKGDAYFSYVLQGDELRDYFRNLNQAPDYPVEFDLNKLPETVHHRSIPFTDGVLFAFTESPLPEDIINTLERFAAVFGQTYTRYLDLQKAEQRTRESKIEASLERVRAKALAMHSSEDLRETITAIFEELKHLNVRPLRLGLGLLNPDKPEGKIVTSRINENEQILEVGGEFKLVGHPILEGVYGHWKKQMDYFPILEGDEIKAYYAALARSVDVQGYGTDERHYGCFLFFREGGLYAWAAEPHSEEQISVLKRFSRVLEIAYRRYNDLIESEAREKEAVKQASLDRVRAEIASMRSTADLDRITPLVWNELTTLGVPFIRCGVFIVHELGGEVQVFLSNPKGESLAVWQSDYQATPLFEALVDSWKKQEVYITEWDRQGFIDFSKLLIQQGLIDDTERYQSGEEAPNRLVLQMLPFKQGMLYVGSPTPLDSDQMELAQALAMAFSVAYARYEDFNQLEKTLGELKATQKQLIHSEKMASLGELTAGIAHEIKNPLNFVNNFSEVSKELMEELMEEMEKGDLEEVRELAGDVVQNLEKIVHHGQRADSIVRGMLQHSRSGDGQKEPTDLNALADEYLRLAYHGLRAKDKSFNASLETDFDPGVGTMELIPQDMGRVILNLLTNAFYAVNEKAVAERAAENKDYEPSVSVKTKKQNGLLELSVSDNGSGIPQKVLDKIFQPFFTTKPTGEGTGLGLSLSYDIVKAHGGELSAESEEGIGTTFFITFKSNP